MHPYEVIEQLKATNSRLDKERIVEEAWKAGCYDFFTGARLACDGLVSFGVKQIPLNSTSKKNSYTFNDFILMTENLSQRKITGHAARDLIEDFKNNCTADEWNGFYSLVLLKDLKAGLSETTINKVLKKIGGKAVNYMVTEFPYQRCSLPKGAHLDEFNWTKGVYSQIKSDGMFANVNLHTDGSVDILSRSGKPFPLEELGDLVQDIQDTFESGTQSHGELLVYRDGKELPRQIGNGILNSIAQGEKFDKGDKPVYVVWDNIPLSSVKAKGTYDKPYEQRYDELFWKVQDNAPDNIKLVECKIVHSMNEAMEHYREVLAKGMEGTIIKEPSATWKDGTSKLQVKLKLEAECDLKIVGFNPGKGKNEKTFGSVQCESSDGLLEVNVSGFSDKDREDIHKRREELMGTIMTVISNSLMAPSGNNEKYSLFLPRCLELRKDKTEADSLQKVKDQFDSIISK